MIDNLLPLPTKVFALLANDTWELVPHPTNYPMVHCMGLFRHNSNSDGNVGRYKALIAANGKSQSMGIDCAETFSLVKPAMNRLLCSPISHVAN